MIEVKVITLAETDIIKIMQSNNYFVNSRINSSARGQDDSREVDMD